MRHSTLDMTMNVYTHAQTEQIRDAIDNLPELGSVSQSEIACATGTDGKQAEIPYKPAYKKLTKKADFGLNQSSLIGTIDETLKETGRAKVNDCKPLIMDTLDTSKNCLSAIDNDEKSNTSGGTRTPNPRFRSSKCWP